MSSKGTAYRPLFLPTRIRRIFSTIALVLFLLVLGVLVLGLRQFFLYHQFSDITESFDHIEYEFIAATNSLSQLLISGETGKIEKLSQHLKTVHADVIDFTQHIVIPDYLKNTLGIKTELISIFSALQTIDNSPGSSAEKKELMAKLNNAKRSFQAFRLALVDYKQQILYGLQNIIIGLLGLSLTACCFLLFAMNKFICAPWGMLGNFFQQHEIAGSSKNDGADSLPDSIRVIGAQHSLLLLLLGIHKERSGQEEGAGPLPFSETAEYVCERLASLPFVKFCWVLKLENDGTHPAVFSSIAAGDAVMSKIVENFSRSDGFDKDTSLSKAAHACLQQGVPWLQHHIADNYLQQHESQETDTVVTSFAVPLKDINKRCGLLTVHCDQEFDFSNTFLVSIELIISELFFVNKKLAARNVFDPDMGQWGLIAAGSLASKTVCAIANSVNVGLNQLQRLLDVKLHQQHPERLEHALLEIMDNERKTANLLKAILIPSSGFQSFFTCSSLEKYMEKVLPPLQLYFVSRQLPLTWNHDIPADLRIRSDIFIISLLTLLQFAEESYERETARGPAAIHLQWHSLAQRKVIQLQCKVNGFSWQSPAPDSNDRWPSPVMLDKLVQQHGCSIDDGSQAESNIISISIPASF